MTWEARYGHVAGGLIRSSCTLKALSSNSIALSNTSDENDTMLHRFTAMIMQPSHKVLAELKLYVILYEAYIPTWLQVAAMQRRLCQQLVKTGAQVRAWHAGNVGSSRHVVTHRWVGKRMWQESGAWSSRDRGSIDFHLSDDATLLPPWCYCSQPTGHPASIIV